MKQNLLELKNDLVFQELFGKQKNSKITGHLISSILGREVKDIDLDLNKRMLGNRINSKTGRLDIRAKFNDGEDCNIELQVLPYKYMEMHILEIPKIKKEEVLKDELALWLKFIENPVSEEVKITMEKKKINI